MNDYCDHMRCRMNRDISTNPMYWTGAAFLSGFLFSTWSWGIVYLILNLIITEILYYSYCRYKSNKYYIEIRLGIIAGTILGFLIGRCITDNNDHDECIRNFWEKYKIL
jgi:lipoprotein signal peptidase